LKARRRIKKVYGQEAGAHVLNALYENPCVAVPIVVARLKQKDEEWKRALREWNRVWKEADSKNYLKSLDHQGIHIKNADKKAVMAKVLVSEIEILKREQLQTRIVRSRGPFMPDMPRHQLQFLIESEAILFDVLKLALALLDRQAGAFPQRDKDRIEEFVRTFVPSLLCISQASVEDNLAPLELPKEAGVDEQASEAGEAASDIGGNASATEDEVVPAAPNRFKKRTKKEVADLRRKALRKNVGPRGNGRGSKTGSPAVDASVSAVSSRENTPDVDMSEAATPEPSNAAVQDNAANGEDMIVDSAEAPYEAPVPAATAGGLDGLEGVQTVGAEAPAIPDAPGSDNMSDSNKSPPESVDMPLGGPAPNEGFGASHMRISHQTLASRVSAASRQRFNFFCGTSHYCLVRILQMCYQRLYHLKQASIELAHAAQYKAQAPEGTSRGHEARKLYEGALETCERFFDGQLDATAFEDAIRKQFGIKGHTIYTIDRLLTAMLRLVSVFWLHRPY
jgi:paired amphipathic helix protein Sin3a